MLKHLMHSMKQSKIDHYCTCQNQLSLNTPIACTWIRPNMTPLYVKNWVLMVGYLSGSTTPGLKKLYPSGRDIHVPEISTRIYWEFQGIIPADIISWFPCGNSGEMKGKFLCGYIRLLSLQSPWGYFHVEISLVLPTKISKCNSMT